MEIGNLNPKIVSLVALNMDLISAATQRAVVIHLLGMGSDFSKFPLREEIAPLLNELGEMHASTEEAYLLLYHAQLPPHRRIPALDGTGLTSGDPSAS